MDNNRGPPSVSRDSPYPDTDYESDARETSELLESRNLLSVCMSSQAPTLHIYQTENMPLFQMSRFHLDCSWMGLLKGHRTQVRT